MQRGKGDNRPPRHGKNASSPRSELGRNASVQDNVGPDPNEHNSSPMVSYRSSKRLFEENSGTKVTERHHTALPHWSEDLLSRKEARTVDFLALESESAFPDSSE